MRDSRLIVLTAIHFSFGHLIEEQTPPDAEMTRDFDLTKILQDYPTIVAGIEEYFNSGRTADDLFNDGLRLIIEGR